MQSKRSDIIALLLSMCVPSLAAFAYMVLLGETPAQVVYVFSRVFLIGFPVAWFLLAERGRPAWPRWSTRGSVLGVVFALVVGAVAWLMYEFWLDEALDWSGVRREADELGLREHYVLFALFLSLINSAMEEYYWRWFVFGRCRRRMSLAFAAPLSGLAFAAHHVVVLVTFLGAGAGTALAGGERP